MQPTIWDWPKKHRGTTESQFYLAPTSLSSTSPYTGQQTAYGPQVQRWTAKLTFPTMRAPDWRPVQAFITRLRGISGAVRMVDYHRMRPARDAFDAVATFQNWSDGTTWSDGKGWASGYLPPFIICDEAADEGDDSIVVRGLPVSSSETVLRMGDLFEVRPNGIPADHGHLYEIVADARTDADGKTRLYIEPGLRKAVAMGDMIVLRYPTSVFNLASDQEGIVSRGLVSLGNMGLALNEVLPWQ
jgi:hypothetical protein